MVRIRMVFYPTYCDGDVGEYVWLNKLSNGEVRGILMEQIQPVMW